jgi:benzoyl-CoA reductase/2-hydroxyglutaryl-CoA dehydratase subunit BcrC/BadD/HgdB
MAKNLLGNFNKPDIISKVAYNKDKRKFLPVNEQLMLSNKLKKKLFRHYDEMKDEESRPQTMKKIDLMMNDLKGQRIKDLYISRREGKHIVDLLCHAIPPELVYAIEDFVPVNVCMAAGELEVYTDMYTQGMCPLTRSMIGLNNTGMCVFFNVADYAIGNDLCHNIKKTVNIFNETCNDLELFLLETDKTNGKIKVDFNSLDNWVKSITNGKGFNKECFKKYAKLFTELRNTYKAIRELRKVQNPPLNGRNSMWIQQLFMVSEPNQLLSTLLELKDELENNIKNNIGYNTNGSKKRVMLITPRIMPPFAEIFRVIEMADAIVVCEEMCMGISNITYDIQTLLNILDDEDSTFEDAAKYILENIDQKECSCSNGFDINMIKKKIEDYKVDAVINFSFKSCPCMEDKTKKITELLIQNGIQAMNFVSDYIEIYDNADLYIDRINDFLYENALIRIKP